MSATESNRNKTRKGVGATAAPKTRPKKKPVSHPISWYRDKEHKVIPESLYIKEQKARYEREKPTGKSVKKCNGKFGPYKVEKNTYAPLGRPPRDNPASFEYYKEMAADMTDKGHLYYSTRKDRDAYYRRGGYGATVRKPRQKEPGDYLPRLPRMKDRIVIPINRRDYEDIHAEPVKFMRHETDYERVKNRYFEKQERAEAAIRNAQKEQTIQQLIRDMDEDELRAEILDRKGRDIYIRYPRFDKMGKKKLAALYYEAVDDGEGIFRRYLDSY